MTSAGDKTPEWRRAARDKVLWEIDDLVYHLRRAEHHAPLEGAVDAHLKKIEDCLFIATSPSEVIAESRAAFVASESSQSRRNKEQT